MYNLTLFKVCKFLIFLLLLLIILYTFILQDMLKSKWNNVSMLRYFRFDNATEDEINIWITFAKVSEKSPLTSKFKQLTINLLNVSSIPLNFHLFVDNASKVIVDEFLKEIPENHKDVYYYDIGESASLIRDIVTAMTPYFSSKPGTYYSDALFYLSLGLYRIAPKKQKKAIMLDCDLFFNEDVRLLFKQFDCFGKKSLFGLAPELSPVYRHILHGYKSHHNTTFGEFRHEKVIYSDQKHPKGFQGYNSGVILLNLEALRNSQQYEEILKATSVQKMADKYQFKGHLGDQDFYTLMGYEHPELIETLSCGFNRQLCTWWRDNGYRDVFEHYAKCDDKLVVSHGNCNTKIPH